MKSLSIRIKANEATINRCGFSPCNSKMNIVIDVGEDYEGCKALGLSQVVLALAHAIK